MEVTATNGKRFAVFHSDGFTLCLMNGYYDDENRNQVITKGDYWEIYDNQSKIANDVNTRKVFINLGVEDLAAEYNRIKRLGIAEQLTEMLYVVVHLVGDGFIMHFILLINGLLIPLFIRNRIFM